MGVRKTLLRLLIGDDRLEAMKTARIGRSPDRVLLLGDYFPAFAARGGRILWVGCKPYTAAYPALLEADGAEVWTLEVDPAGEAWGRAGRHRTGDVRRADSLFGGMAFDSVLCNGVLGHGVDSPDDQGQALAAMGAILKPGGCLLLGWNTGTIADPLAAGLTGAMFEPRTLGALPARQAVPGVTHVYDLLRRNNPG